MGLLDTIFCTGLETTEKIPCEKQYCKTNSIINRRDVKGRTPLFAAVAFNNKQAVETLLHLGANPHIEDVYGQRPSDICYVEAIKGLLDVKMSQVPKPSQVLDLGISQKVELNLKMTQCSNISSSKMGGSNQLQTKEEKTYPLEIKDIKQYPKEKVISARIGSESDTYLHYAIKNKRLDLLKFLLKEVPEIDLLVKNS